MREREDYLRAANNNNNNFPLGQQQQQMANNNVQQQLTSRALGLDAVHNLCKELYPQQGNPLTVTAVVKYW